MEYESTPTPPVPPLTPQQIHTYLRDGILVVDNILSSEEIIEAQYGLASTLKEDYGVDVHDLESTGHNLVKASSTNGAGGVLDIFYPEWKLKVATNETLFRMTCHLWKEAYCNSGEKLEDLSSPPTDSNFDCHAGDDDDNAYDYDRMGERSDSKSVECENGHNEDNKNVGGLGKDASFQWHPFGAFDYNTGYMYIDRIGYRVPTTLSERIGEQISTNGSFQESTIHVITESMATASRSKSGFKSRPLQRSLTPHFDCCPENYHDASKKNKWRPIQCFVSLTDNLQPNTGGFEACPGFHREFHSWVENGRGRQRRQDQPITTDDSGSSRPEDDGDVGGCCTPRQSAETKRRPTNKKRQLKQRTQSRQQQPPLCVGEYTHVSPSLDQDIMQRMVHIPVRAGSAVFWDNRIPHGNSYRNDPRPTNHDADTDSGGVFGGDNGDGMGSSMPLGTSGARAVVYCSFLPDVEVNRRFIVRQLKDWMLKRPPSVGDRWIRQQSEIEERTTKDDDQLSELGKRLLGLVEWPRAR